MSKDQDLDLSRLAQSVLDTDIRTENYHLKVTVSGGVAQVTGIVDTLSEREQVEQIMSGIKGLKGFDNGVSISTDGSIVDEDVVEEVNEELGANPGVDLRHVGVKSVKGNVLLVGTVNGPEEEKAAIRIASRARGARSVVSQLKINDKSFNIDDLGAIFHHQVNNDRENPERKDIF